MKQPFYTMTHQISSWDKKGVVASYQAALSEEYTPLERVQPVLTWSRGCPGHNKIESGDQIE